MFVLLNHVFSLFLGLNYPEHTILMLDTKTKSLACSEAELLLKVLLDLLQPVQPVLDLQVNLRLLEMVPNDSPYPKTWG